MVIGMPFTHPPRPPRGRTAAGARAGAGLAIALAATLLLGGCTDSPAPSPSPAPSQSAAPIFASDEEALAAAVEAYERYLAVSTAVSNDGGTEPDRLAAVAMGRALDEEIVAAKDLQDQGVRTVGTVGFRVKELQSYIAGNGARAEIVVYLCEDLRSLDVLDASGESLVAEGRVVDIPYTVAVSADGTNDLKVSEKELWPRDNFCLQ